MDHRQPLAVVVGTGLNALGVVRSLAQQQIPIVILGAEQDAALASRYGEKRLIAATEGAPLVAGLHLIARAARGKPVLFLTEEKSVQTVSERRAEILPHFHCTLPDQQTLAILLHKEGFQRRAQELGCAIPKAIHLRGEPDLAKLSTLRYPCVLKPAVKDYDYGARFQKAYVVESAAAAATRFREIAPTLSDLIIQEWIEGNDADIYFCLQYISREHVTVASFVGRKLRSWPPRIGGTASCTAAPEFQGELTAQTTDFFRQAGFVGMGSMEYKRDRRDGRFYMIEPTVGRTDFQEEVATIHGVNIPLAAYCHEVGLPPPIASHSTVLKIWRDPVTDKWSAEQQPELLPPRGVAVVDAYFRLDDPRPWLVLLWSRIKGRVGALIGA